MSSVSIKGKRQIEEVPLFFLSFSHTVYINIFFMCLHKWHPLLTTPRRFSWLLFFLSHKLLPFGTQLLLIALFFYLLPIVIFSWGFRFIHITTRKIPKTSIKDKIIQPFISINKWGNWFMYNFFFILLPL
jgi:hypothetical protein